MNAEVNNAPGDVQKSMLEETKVTEGATSNVLTSLKDENPCEEKPISRVELFPPLHNLEIRETSNAGFGLFATSDFPDTLTEIGDETPAIYLGKNGVFKQEYVARLNAVKQAQMLCLDPGVDSTNLNPEQRLKSIFDNNKMKIYDANLMEVGKGLYLFFSALNHSCIPNCECSFFGKRLLIRNSRPIRKGEELTISYTQLLKPKTIRQKILLNDYGFICKCSRCLNETQKESNAIQAFDNEKEKMKSVMSVNDMNGALMHGHNALKIWEAEDLGSVIPTDLNYAMLCEYYGLIAKRVGNYPGVTAESAFKALKEAERIYTLKGAKTRLKDVRRSLVEPVGKKKQKPNDRCQCGSGKKFKKCCGKKMDGVNL